MPKSGPLVFDASLLQHTRFSAHPQALQKLDKDPHHLNKKKIFKQIINISSHAACSRFWRKTKHNLLISSLSCMSCSHQGSWPPAAAAASSSSSSSMWEEFSACTGWPGPAQAEAAPPLPRSQLSSLPPAASLLFHMTARRWLSPVGSPWMSWRSSSCCCPLQVDTILFYFSKTENAVKGPLEIAVLRPFPFILDRAYQLNMHGLF